MVKRIAKLYEQAKRNAWGRTFTCQQERNMYVAEYLVSNDVVQVVRCKDCKHWNNGDCYRLELSMPNDFCSYGEAKMDGKGEK